MESPLSSIQTRLENIKGKLFPSNFDIYMFVNPSAYDTAWLAIIPDSKYPSQPMFKNYLDWLLNNQSLEGFWGESDTFGNPTIQALPATIVSMVALKRWKCEASMIEKGMNFIYANAEKLLNEVKESCPLWEEAVGNLHYYPPLLSYLEALPPCYASEEDISKNLSRDGSLFQSPSASAKAFMATGNEECLTYLQSLAQKFPNGVPQAYPMDEDHIKLCIVNQLQKLGLGEIFVGEIEVLLAQVYRISYHYNNELLQLAIQNFEFKQSIFKKELEELKRWTEEWGISKMGFGREKTTYCYFAIAASTTFIPHDSYIRMLVAKSGIIVTVADDFFDMIGSSTELEALTFAWYETFLAWLIEAKWSRNGHTPSMDCYMKTSMTSIATHNLVLPASCFLKPILPKEKLRPIQYESLTKLLMILSRLSNDILSYQKEKEDGKLNSVFLNMLESPELDIEDSIACIRETIVEKRKEFFEHVLIDDGLSDLSKPTKLLHLSCFKVFQMFYNSKNSFDSDKDLVEDINRAIYLPVSRTIKPLSLHPMVKKKYNHQKFSSVYRSNNKVNFTTHQVSPLALSNGYGKVFMPMKIGLGFV
ncbi:unnamed protein product [Lupinus luteus]|uniref:Terpene synthase metal-binding domain-containing protein n=1 Tax=Lupinus luteus TaxID=3873 RepID=A0AAV1WJ38_LUPLU